MEGSEKKDTFPLSPFRSSPKGSDENNRSNQETDLNLQNPKKQQIVKNFMSAVSKASVPRKKILAERNESSGSNSFHTHLSKTPILDSKIPQKTIPKVSLKNSPNLDTKLTPKEPCSQRIPSSYNSRDETPSPRPYDPLTNYLSPRPQFLRYNPDRRKEIFLRLEMEENEGDDGSSVGSVSSSDSKKADGDEVDIVSSDTSLQKDEGDEEIGVESDEEAEEEIGWSLRGILEYMLLLVVLVLTTWYIASMKTVTPAPAFQGLLPLGYQTIQNHSHVIAAKVELKYNFFNGNLEQVGLLGLKQATDNDGIEEIKNVIMGETVSLEAENGNYDSAEIVEKVEKGGENEVACEGGEAPNEFSEDLVLFEKKTLEKIEVDKDGDVEETGGGEDDLVNYVSHQLVENIELLEGEETGEQIEDVTQVDEVVQEIEERLLHLHVIDDDVSQVDVFYQLVEDTVLQGRVENEKHIEDVEKVAVADIKENGERQDALEEQLAEAGKVSDHIVEMFRDVELSQGDMASLLTDHQEAQAASLTTVSSEKERVGEEIHKETRDYDNMVQGRILGFANSISMATLERWSKSMALNFEQLVLLKGINHNIGTEILIIIIFGVLTCATIVASLAFGSNMRRNKVASKHTSLVDKQSPKAVVLVKEKPSLVLPAELEEHRMQAKSYINTMPFISSAADKDVKEAYYHSRAPSVQLLGEFEVGEGGISSSLKTRASKSRMTDEVSSSYSLGSKAYSASVQDQDEQDFSDFSSDNSNLYGKLSAKKTQSRSNDMAGTKGEVVRNNVVTTPLRRSARIRSRADVASP